MRNIEEIAWDLCELYYKTKSPIDENGNVIYYMAGSLATLPFICADSMQEIMIDNGKRLNKEWQAVRNRKVNQNLTPGIILKSGARGNIT